jgi:N-acetylmuramoyl-L-alanine amidase
LFKKETRIRGLVIVKSSSRRRSLWSALLLTTVCFVVCAPFAQARAHHSDAWARERFAAAERMREALNGRPPAERTRHDYQRVLNAYRNVYLGAPTSSKADPSVVAVAETLVEMGRRFDDDKILHAAIDQYRFLRREYPGSKFRFDALFTIAEIYKDDLNDPEAARSAFQEFLKRYPHNRLADDACDAIAELDKEARSEKVASAAKEPGQGNFKNDAGAESKRSARKAENTQASTKDGPSQPRPVHLPRVTALRHWSTPDYTRVAIDVESDVKFSSQRIDNPARIFFDLHNTRLASTLVGKSFDVDDGFLKKVRLAQFAPGRTRVVLEIDGLSNYEAFLLPNPYRLIIDIHGKNAHEKHGASTEETTLAKAAGAGAASATPDAALNPEGSEPSTDGAVHAASPESDTEIAKSSSYAVDSTPHDSSVAARSATVVKKIVEADDEDPDDQNASPAAHRKSNKALTTGARNVHGSKQHEPDLDSDGAVPHVPSADAESTTASREKTSARTLVSSRADSPYDFSAREAKPTASGDRSLIRTLGLKIGKIVIDPGHGGHDTGTIGPNGLEEKDLVLDVGRRLGKLLEARLGAEVVYTRKDDTFIPLETRTAIANQARADLFVSIHANSSRDSAARGVETYYLNFTSSPGALEVAARENAVSEKSIFELQDLVRKIALKEKVEESREFASDVQQSLHSGLAAKSPAIRDRGVKKAPFIVLIGANMPSILAEISFVSNPTDERRLETAEYRQRIAESLYRGIAKYANGLSGVKIASKMEKASGQ